ncbi:MAG: hypothetical protein Q9225_006132, partial [Loekoesia sp. 1 TL-2023]
MSIGAKSKALHLGIQSGKPAEDEGWGEGQPKIKVMGRELRVMRRWGYEWQDDSNEAPKEESIKREEEGESEEPSNADNNSSTIPTDTESQETIKADPSSSSEQNKQPSPATPKDTEPPL